MTLEHSFDGEELRDLLLKREDPQNLSLGQLVKEIIYYAQILSHLPLSGGKPDHLVIEEACQNRLFKIYHELDLREKFYQDKGEK